MDISLPSEIDYKEHLFSHPFLRDKSLEYNILYSPVFNCLALKIKLDLEDSRFSTFRKGWSSSYLDYTLIQGDEDFEESEFYIMYNIESRFKEHLIGDGYIYYLSLVEYRTPLFCAYYGGVIW